MRRIQIFFIAIFALLLVLPGAACLVTAPRWIRLSGVTLPRPDLVLTLQAVVRGELQGALEELFRRRSAAWPALVRTDNQLNLWIFGELSSNYDSAVAPGRSGNLLERVYLKAFNRVKPIEASKLEQRAADLAALQARLDGHGVKMLVVISPSKLEFYPELVPKGLSAAGREERQNAAGVLLPRLAALRINVFDSRAFLKDPAPGAAHALFPRGGTHWSELGACLVAGEILNRAAALLGKPLAKLSCAAHGQRKRPPAGEVDLAQLANLWFPERFEESGPKLLRQVENTGVFRPKVLIEGTSFVFALMRSFARADPFSRFDFYYYFSRVYPLRERTYALLERTRLDLRRELLARDLLIFEINESALDEIGHGLIEAALAALNES